MAFGTILNRENCHKKWVFLIFLRTVYDYSKKSFTGDCNSQQVQHKIIMENRYFILAQIISNKLNPSILDGKWFALKWKINSNFFSVNMIKALVKNYTRWKSDRLNIWFKSIDPHVTLNPQFKSNPDPYDDEVFTVVTGQIIRFTPP